MASRHDYRARAMTETLARQIAGSGEWLIVLGPLFVIAYAIPTFIAIGRKHRHVTAIGLINGLLGWTLLGWLAAIIWAVNRDLREKGEDTESAWPSFFLSEPRLNEPTLNGPAGEALVAETGAMRQCRYCAESIKVEALVCRYCGRESGVVQPGAQPGIAVNVASIEM
ncbi:MAG: superinfection immunity protein, partial [Betaproteobacteria bacterium]